MYSGCGMSCAICVPSGAVATVMPGTTVLTYIGQTAHQFSEIPSSSSECPQNRQFSVRKNDCCTAPRCLTRCAQKRSRARSSLNEMRLTSPLIHPTTTFQQYERLNPPTRVSSNDNCQYLKTLNRNVLSPSVECVLP